MFVLFVMQCFGHTNVKYLHCTNPNYIFTETLSVLIWFDDICSMQTDDFNKKNKPKTNAIKQLGRKEGRKERKGKNIWTMSYSHEYETVLMSVMKACLSLSCFVQLPRLAIRWRLNNCTIIANNESERGELWETNQSKQGKRYQTAG